MKHITAIILAASIAMPMAATPAASWGVITKWWDSNKDKVKDGFVDTGKWAKGAGDKVKGAFDDTECLKSGLSLTAYKPKDKKC